MCVGGGGGGCMCVCVGGGGGGDTLLASVHVALVQKYSASNISCTEQEL